MGTKNKVCVPFRLNAASYFLSTEIKRKWNEQTKKTKMERSIQAFCICTKLNAHFISRLLYKYYTRYPHYIKNGCDHINSSLPKHMHVLTCSDVCEDKINTEILSDGAFSHQGDVQGVTFLDGVLRSGKLDCYYGK